MRKMMQTGEGGKGEREGKWDKDDEDEEEHEDEDEERGGGECVRMRGGFEPAHWHWHCAFTHDENLMVGSCGVSQRRLATTRSRVRGMSFGAFPITIRRRGAVRSVLGLSTLPNSIEGCKTRK